MLRRSRLRPIARAFAGLSLLIAQPSRGEPPPEPEMPSALRFGGPIELMDLFLPSQLRPQAAPESASVLPAGSFSVRSVVEWANDNARDEDGRFLFDGESVNTVVRLRYTPHDRLEVGVDVPWTSRSSGDLDTFIQKVENFADSKVQDRYELETSQFAAVAFDDARQQTLRMRKATDVGDVSLRARYAIFREAEDGFDAAISAGLGLPTGGDTFGGEGVTPMLGLHGQVPFRTVNLFAGGTIQYHSDATEQSFPLAPYRWMTYFGSEWRPWNRWIDHWFGLLVEGQFYGPIARGYGPLNQVSCYYAAGFRFYLPGNFTIETAAVENLGKIQNRNSSDVSFHFGLGWRFDGLPAL